MTLFRLSSALLIGEIVNFAVLHSFRNNDSFESTSLSNFLNTSDGDALLTGLGALLVITFIATLLLWAENEIQKRPVRFQAKEYNVDRTEFGDGYMPWG